MTTRSPLGITQARLTVQPISEPAQVATQAPKPKILKNVECTRATNTWHVLVTPDLAYELLTANELNRPINQFKVEEWATAMKTGRWRDIHQGVAIDTEGRVLDGQHRLMAIIETNIPMWMRISFEESRENFPLIDVGRRRVAPQFMKVKHATAVAGAARILSIFDGTTDAIDIQDLKTKNSSMSNILESVGRWPELNAWSSKAASAYSATRISTSLHLVVIAMAARTAYADGINDWFEGLTDGIGLYVDDPRTHLRNRWSRDYRILSGTGRKQGLISIMKSWNAYVTQSPMRQLKVAPTEEFPLVVGWEHRDS